MSTMNDDPESGASRDPKPFARSIVGSIFRTVPERPFDPCEVLREGRKLYRDAVLYDRKEDADEISTALCEFLAACANRISPADEPGDDDETS